jgi:hypothetical protein
MNDSNKSIKKNNINNINDKHLKVDINKNIKCYTSEHNNLYKHLDDNLNIDKEKKKYIKQLEKEINKYNNLKCKWKKTTKISVFFILISFIMIIKKKKNSDYKYNIDLIFYMTLINLILSLMFHHEYCPHNYKFYLRYMDILIAFIIWCIGIHYGNYYTLSIGIIMICIFIFELYYHKYFSSDKNGKIHSIIHVLHPIMMYTVIFM